MTLASTLAAAIREAWAAIPAPPAEDLKYMAWGWGDDAARAFVGVAPMDVDITSVGFFAATPLLDLPPRAAAAYLGTYLLALLRSLEQQEQFGMYPDPMTRAHIITCLELPTFWEQVIRPFLPRPCREVLLRVVHYLVAEREALPLTDEQVERLPALAAEGVAGPAGT